MPQTSLRIKLLIGVLALLLPMLGSILLDVQAEHEQRRETSLDAQARTAGTVSTLIDTLFADSVSLGWALGNDPIIRSLDPDLIDPHLQRLAPRYPQYVDIEVFNLNGESAGASFPYETGEPRVNVARFPHFQRAVATGQPAISEVFQAVRWDGRPIAVIAVPVLDNSRPIGAIHLVFDLTHLPLRFTAVHLGPDEAISVIDPRGRIAYFSQRPDLRWDERDVSHLPEVQAALTGQTVRTDTFHSPLLGNVRAAAFVRSPQSGWVVAVSSPAASVFAPVEDTFRRGLAVLLVMAVLGIFGAWLLSGYLVGPLRQLAVLARALGRGDLSRRANVQTGDELQDLAETLNAMATQLQVTTGRLQAVFNSMADAVYIADAGGRLVETNPAGRDLLGMHSDEPMLPLGEYVERFSVRHLNGTPLQAADLPLARALRGETFTGHEFRFQKEPGGDRLASASGASVQNEQGEVTLAVTVVRDITERRQAEEERARLLARERVARAAAEAAEGRIANILESITDAFIALDGEWRFTYVNKRAEELLLRKRSELIGQSVWEEFPEAVGTTFYEEYHRAIAEQVTAQFEAFYAPLSTWFRVHAYPAKDGLSVYFVDMTEERRRKRARLGLARLAQRIVTIQDVEHALATAVTELVESFDIALARVWLWDENERSLAVRASAGLDIGQGVDSSQQSARPSDQFAIETIVTSRRPLVNDDLQHEPWLEAQEWVAEEGIIAFAGFPLLVANRLLGVIGLFSRRRPDEDDLSALATVADQLAIAIENARLLKRLHVALQLREQFIAAAAHELRTPITALKGYIGLLRRLPEIQTAEVTRALDVIERSTARVARLADELAEVSELERGAMSLQNERFDLAELALQVVEIVQAESPRYQFRLEALPAIVNADRRRMAEVIRHLLDNAVKYQSQGGSIDVAVCVEPNRALLTVTDYGAGIPPERQPYIFEPMYEPLPPGAPSYVGVVGLGLPISKQIVEQEGGKVWFRSQPGQGSTFYVALPLALSST